MRCSLLILSFAIIFAAVNCEESKKEGEEEELSKEVCLLNFGLGTFSMY